MDVSAGAPAREARAGDGSPFAIRGVIEGFYGRPWTHQQRLDLIPFLAERGMNSFVYGPKDDPLLRRDWRLPYDGQWLTRLSELLERCASHGMRFTWCVSPGLSMRYSDDADLEALSAKLASVAELGVTSIGLLLDDIPRELQHPQDRARFEDLADAHVHVVRRVAERLATGTHLVVCPTLYRGRGTEDYLVRLAAGIDPRIDLFWTGRAICSPVLDLADAAVFTRATLRPPLYWDNYPVNDVAMGYELHIGPYRGRDPLLWRSAAGIVANGMELFEASRIPFATIADYLRDPEGYDPETSWQRAIIDVVGEADADAFALFADNVRSSVLADDDAPVVGRAVERLGFALDQGADAVRVAARDLAQLADRLLAAVVHLQGDGVTNRALMDECRPWLEGVELGARALARMADLAQAGRLDSEGAAELRSFLIRLRRARVRVFGDVLEMTLSDLTGMMFRPGEGPGPEGGAP
jgi:hyaluronoglucosaminidase